MQVDDERIIHKVELFICIVCLMHVDEEAIVANWYSFVVNVY